MTYIILAVISFLAGMLLRDVILKCNYVLTRVDDVQALAKLKNDIVRIESDFEARWTKLVGKTVHSNDDKIN